MNVMFTEGPATLNWSAIMKNVNEDPAIFFRDGGWSFLQEASDEEGGESDDSGSVFEVDSEDLLSESSEEYSTDYSEANEEGDESDSEVDEDEEDEDDSDYDD
ncbi:FACT complex subunit spt16 [Coelomomyces lativittatus]|nr:FACT complex subunit spt16 [Coelomomyces lativittatus]